MTLNDIKREICSLGFERQIASDDTLLFAVRRALMCAYTERGVYGTVSLHQHLCRPDFVCLDLLYSDTPLSYSFDKGAYYAVVSGEGQMVVEDGSGTEVIPFSSPEARMTGVRHTPFTVTFRGDYCYTVSTLLHFPTTSARVDSYATAPSKEYELREAVPDFLGAAAVPTDSHGRPIEGCAVVSGTLSLPSDYVGEVRIRYRKAPPEISLGNADRELGIEPELEHLIPLLAAAYYWLDDDGQKAQQYMTQYRNMMSALKLYSAQIVDDGYRDVTGWC